MVGHDSLKHTALEDPVQFAVIAVEVVFTDRSIFLLRLRRCIRSRLGGMVILGNNGRGCRMLSRGL